MSMIGNELLNQIVTVMGCYAPDLILEKLDEGIRYALQQTTSGNRDGMDVAVCSIFPERGKAYFAGAARPLCYVQGNQLKMLAGTRRGLGGQQYGKRQIAFQEHEIILDQPTKFYLFSDGYPDQFGGKQGRKLTTKQFVAQLAKGIDLPMSEQQTQLLQMLHDWKGDQRQIDDILVFGISLNGSGTH